MKRWRSALIAGVVGALVLLAGYLIDRPPGEGGSSSAVQAAAGDAVLACTEALRPACDALAVELGTTAGTYRSGTDPGRGTVVIAPAADLFSGLEVGDLVARSPIAIAVWQDRAGVLGAHCGGAINLACLSAAFGEEWEDLGGLPSWGGFKLGLADPTLSEAGLTAWRAVAGAGVPPGLEAALRLQADGDAGLMADVLLFGTARADVVVTTEVAISGQLANAPGRGGRLVVSYPDPAPWVEYVVGTSGGRGTDDLIAGLLSDDLQSRLGAFGLRPARVETSGLADGLGTPGVALPAMDETDRTALLDSWKALR
ncbi:MAG: substrate-binding domain-containing protein [Acidimicrobiia bacterium]|nr:substrate-binding domain-containing protein [Acidimicrobiia bacterium]